MTTATPTKISITRALAERKLIEAQIQRGCMTPFVGIQKGTGQGGNTPEVVGVSNLTVEAAKTRYQGNFDSVKALIKRRDQITAKIVLSNATTLVNIAGVEMPVAVAIERKNSIKFEKSLVQAAMQQHAANEAKITQANDQLEVRIQTQISNVLNKEKGKATIEEQKQVSDPMTNSQKHLSINPNDLGVWAVKQLELINAFEVEVDFCLSESNAKTEITLD